MVKLNEFKQLRALCEFLITLLKVVNINIFMYERFLNDLIIILPNVHKYKTVNFHSLGILFFSTLDAIKVIFHIISFQCHYASIISITPKIKKKIIIIALLEFGHNLSYLKPKKRTK